MVKHRYGNRSIHQPRDNLEHIGAKHEDATSRDELIHRQSTAKEVDVEDRPRCVGNDGDPAAERCDSTAHVPRIVSLGLPLLRLLQGPGCRWLQLTILVLLRMHHLTLQAARQTLYSMTDCS